MPLLMIGGLLATLVWLVLSALYVSNVVGWSAFLAARPNEIGDALAGTFAPLAFLWLVIGYFQQSRELRQNSVALNDQAEQTKRLAAEAEKQAESIRLTAEHSQKDTFFRVAEVMENDLRIIAYRISDFMDDIGFRRAMTDREVWERVGAGDKGLFMRIVSNQIDRNWISTKRVLSDSSKNFLVRQYVRVFDKLLEEAAKIDDESGRIRQLYLYADSGDLYRKACRILDREMLYPHLRPDRSRGARSQQVRATG